MFELYPYRVYYKCIKDFRRGERNMKKQWALIGMTAMLIMSGCGNAGDSNSNDAADTAAHEDHSAMNHSSSGEVPEGLKEAANPKYKVGDTAQMTTDHMSGMKGAEAKITGAYDTTVYTVSYTPVTGGEEVTDHKWVIHEEIQDAGSEPFAPGSEVVLLADHMEGMKGAEAKIDSAKPTTVYMVDFTPTTGGEPVSNHKWVTEEELAAL